MTSGRTDLRPRSFTIARYGAQKSEPEAPTVAVPAVPAVEAPVAEAPVASAVAGPAVATPGVKVPSAEARRASPAGAISQPIPEVAAVRVPASETPESAPGAPAIQPAGAPTISQPSPEAPSVRVPAAEASKGPALQVPAISQLAPEAPSISKPFPEAPDVRVPVTEAPPITDPAIAVPIRVPAAEAPRGSPLESPAISYPTPEAPSTNHLPPEAPSYGRPTLGAPPIKPPAVAVPAIRPSAPGALFLRIPALAAPPIRVPPSATPLVPAIATPAAEAPKATKPAPAAKSYHERCFVVTDHFHLLPHITKPQSPANPPKDSFLHRFSRALKSVAVPSQFGRHKRDPPMEKPMFVTTVKSGVFLEPPPGVATLLGLRKSGSSERLSNRRSQPKDMLYSFSSKPRVVGSTGEPPTPTNGTLRANGKRLFKRHVETTGRENGCTTTSAAGAAIDGSIQFGGNTMHDRRVARGSNFASLRLNAPATENVLSRQAEARRRAAVRQRAQIRARKLRSRTPPPIDGRKHGEMQTDKYLEELTDREMNTSAIGCQADLLSIDDEDDDYRFHSSMSNMTTPRIDAQTQLDESDLIPLSDSMDNYDEVQGNNVISFAVNKILREAILEINAEIEKVQNTKEIFISRLSDSTLDRENNMTIIFTKHELCSLLRNFNGQNEHSNWPILDFEEISYNSLVDEVFQYLRMILTDVDFLANITKKQLESRKMKVSDKPASPSNLNNSVIAESTVTINSDDNESVFHKINEAEIISDSLVESDRNERLEESEDTKVIMNTNFNSTETEASSDLLATESDKNENLLTPNANFANSLERNKQIFHNRENLLKRLEESTRDVEIDANGPNSILLETNTTPDSPVIENNKERSELATDAELKVNASGSILIETDTISNSLATEDQRLEKSSTNIQEIVGTSNSILIETDTPPKNSDNLPRKDTNNPASSDNTMTTVSNLRNKSQGEGDEIESNEKTEIDPTKEQHSSDLLSSEGEKITFNSSAELENNSKDILNEQIQIIAKTNELQDSSKQLGNLEDIVKADSSDIQKVQMSSNNSATEIEKDKDENTSDILEPPVIEDEVKSNEITVVPTIPKAIANEDTPVQDIKSVKFESADQDTLMKSENTSFEEKEDQKKLIEDNQLETPSPPKSEEIKNIKQLDLAKLASEEENESSSIVNNISSASDGVCSTKAEIADSENTIDRALDSSERAHNEIPALQATEIGNSDVKSEGDNLTESEKYLTNGDLQLVSIPAIAIHNSETDTHSDLKTGSKFEDDEKVNSQVGQSVGINGNTAPVEDGDTKITEEVLEEQIKLNPPTKNSTIELIKNEDSKDAEEEKLEDNNLLETQTVTNQVAMSAEVNAGDKPKDTNLELENVSQNRPSEHMLNDGGNEDSVSIQEVQNNEDTSSRSDNPKVNEEQKK